MTRIPGSPIGGSPPVGPLTSTQDVAKQMKNPEISFDDKISTLQGLATTTLKEVKATLNPVDELSSEIDRIVNERGEDPLELFIEEEIFLPAKEEKKTPQGEQRSPSLKSTAEIERRESAKKHLAEAARESKEALKEAIEQYLDLLGEVNDDVIQRILDAASTEYTDQAFQRTAPKGT